MKSFKVLAFLVLAATLSCGSPTNATQATDGSTDGFIKVIKRNTQVSDLVQDNYLQPITNAALFASHDNAEFTKNFVAGMWDNNKNYNYVVCYSKSQFTASFDGVEGAAWAQAGLIGLYKANYHLFVGGSGTFTRGGKGGYEKWAWKGAVNSDQDLHSNVITFVKPGSGGAIRSGGD